MLLDKCGSLLIQMSTIAAIFALNISNSKKVKEKEKGRCELAARSAIATVNGRAG